MKQKSRNHFQRRPKASHTSLHIPFLVCGDPTVYDVIEARQVLVHSPQSEDAHCPRRNNGLVTPVTETCVTNRSY